MVRGSLQYMLGFDSASSLLKPFRCIRRWLRQRLRDDAPARAPVLYSRDPTANVLSSLKWISVDMGCRTTNKEAQMPVDKSYRVQLGEALELLTPAEERVGAA